jgi:hypothetical protein
MAKDLLGSLVTRLADLGHEVGSQLSDPGARAALMARAGVVPPAGAPPTAAGSLNRLEGLKSGGADADALQRIEELSLAMIDLVAYLQEATQVPGTCWQPSSTSSRWTSCAPVARRSSSSVRPST